MCKYAMVAYKPHYICFSCRKGFKRRLLWDINRDDKREVDAKCPQCAELMAGMGFDFEVPPMDDVKSWDHIRNLYSVGIVFHSCGCTGPGYVPSTSEKLVAYLEEQKACYEQHLTFWRNRTETSDARALQSERDKFGGYMTNIPYELRDGKTGIKNEDAITYWLTKLNYISGQIATAASGDPTSMKRWSE